MINIPPITVFILGCSLITNHTQSGPKVVSSTKNNSTSCAGIYLGARVKSASGTVTKTIHIIGTI